MNKDSKQKVSKEPITLARRELITKYGAYTAPVVVALLSPANSYSDEGMGGTVYSTSAACQSDTSANAGAFPYHNNPIDNGSHCMVGGMAGGMRTHRIIEHD